MQMLAFVRHVEWLPGEIFPASREDFDPKLIQP